MADTISLKISVDGAGSALNGMLDRAGLISGWLNRVAYPTLMRAQRERWASQNASEGSSWPTLNARYEAWKQKHFQSYPGSGRQMMVATSQLLKAATGEDLKHHRKLVTATRLEVGIEEDPPSKKSRSNKKRSKTIAGFEGADIPPLSYASFANELRNFTKFGPGTIAELKTSLSAYIRTGRDS